MSRSFETTENDKTILNIVPDDHVILFGDGFGPAMIGYPNTKFTLFQQTLGIPDSAAVERQIVATVSVPTVALVELAAHIQRVLNENKEQFTAEVNSQISKILGES